MVKNNIIYKTDNNITLFLNKMSNDVALKYVLLAMVFSYFYNLPFIKYNALGNNEFRIYDIAGFFVCYHYYIYFKFTNFIIEITKPLKWLLMFLKYASFMILITLFFFVYFDMSIYFIQCILYLYHFYVFFLTSVLLYILSFKKSNLQFFLKAICIFSILCCLVVILQNFNLIPFLWNDNYFKTYLGFLSGTLGPNKIVLGMTSLIMFCFSVGLLVENNYKLNRILIITAILFNLYVILISGSRTTYVGLLVFLGFFAIFKTSKFLLFGLIFITLSLSITVLNDNFYSKIEQVFNQRVLGKVRSKNDLSKQKVGDLYEDLGSGRSQLAKGNAIFLLENPAIIPFGVGFNNWSIIGEGLSAHNMYLQVIKELGLVGFVLYFGWLIQYLLIDFKQFKGFAIALKGLVVSMLVTLFFGEHLYIYRPVFAILGLFLAVTVLSMSILHKNENIN
jgi:O-Antigen ligase